MSYNVYLERGGVTLHMDEPHGVQGGTYGIGDDECWLNVTYNYSTILDRFLPDGLRGLHGHCAFDTIPMLETAVQRLRDDTHPDYWQATEGNVKEALEGLLVFARAHPDGYWRVS